MRGIQAVIVSICCQSFSSALAATVPRDISPRAFESSNSGSPVDAPASPAGGLRFCLGNDLQRFEIPDSPLSLLFEYEEQLHLSDVKDCLVSAGAWLNAQTKTDPIPGSGFSWPDGPVKLEIKKGTAGDVTWQNVVDIVRGVKKIEYESYLEYKAVNFDVQTGDSCGPIIASGNLRRYQAPSSTTSSSPAPTGETIAAL